MPSAQAITAFTRVSKNVPSLKRKAVDDEEVRPTKRHVTSLPDQENQKKEKPTARIRGKRAHRPSDSTLLSRSNDAQRKAQAKREATHKKPTTSSNDLQFDDLIGLHRAFLRTLVVQIAHSGSASPIDIAVFAPNTTRSWGKRRVRVDDVRRCIALQAPISPFVLADYGKGRVCVEVVAGATIDEDALTRRFEENVRATLADRMEVDVPLGALSLADLPRADVTDMAAGRANPLLTKGQKALEALKAKPEEKTAAVETHHPDGRKMNLLDRLRAKEIAREKEAAGASGPELQRRAALNRVADVAATLSMLSLATPLSLPRQAFTMATISEKLRDSLRVPTSKEEGVACIKLIAKEVAPEWLRVVAIGGRENVVIQRNGQPVDRVIAERVRRLLG